MHPVLASPRRLALYLVAWVPFLVLVDGILRGAGMHGWQRLALSTAMTVVYAFFALSAWFVDPGGNYCTFAGAGYRAAERRRV